MSIIKVTRAVSFMKPHVGLLFFVTDNQSFDPFALETYYHESCYIKSTINTTGNSDKNHNDKEYKNKYLIEH